MDDAMLILKDTLENHGFDEELTLGILMPLEEDEDMLYLSEWVTNHPEAQRRDVLRESHNLIRKRAI